MTSHRIRQTPVFETLVDELMTSFDDDEDAVAPRSANAHDHAALWSINSVSPGREPRPVPAQLYKPEDFEPEAPPLPAELPTDPETIFDELGLKPGLSEDQIAIARRRFAMRNHPDRFPLELQKNATERMMIANALCDGYPLTSR